MPDSARPDTLRNDTDVLSVSESRDFRSYQDYLRVIRTFIEGPLLKSMQADYQAATTGKPAPTTPDDAMAVLDPLPQFQFYSWAYRHLQRLKYHQPTLGIFDQVHAEGTRLAAELDKAAAVAGDELKLDPTVPIPEYYRMVDFHQHVGGVWSDPLDGIVYEIGRRTTTPSHLDPNAIYRMAYSQLPTRSYARVLDWGTGHGAGLMQWQKLHPESECHGADISAPCLKLAHKRAREAGYRMFFAQMDLEHLRYPDNHFDLAFHLFMFHELPPVTLKAMLKEVHRVLKPGGLFAGPEFHIPGDDPFHAAVQISHAWTNNETFSPAWYAFDMEKAAKEAGFSKVSIGPFAPMARMNRAGIWRHYILEK